MNTRLKTTDADPRTICFFEKARNLIQHKMKDDSEERGDDDRATEGPEEQFKKP